MELDFKPDFETAREDWAAFWRGESARPLFHAVVPKDGVTPTPRPRPYDCAFGDLDPIIDQALAWAGTHDFPGDTIPSFMITFAPDHFAALLGAKIERSEAGKTNWVEPCLTSLDDVEITFQRDGHWWKRTVECVERFRERCDGKLIITGTHLQGSLDALVALYGTQPLLLDMAMDPGKVHRALKQVDTAYQEVRTALTEVLDVSTWGSLNRFGMYSPGVIDVPQCDVSCMISKEMFDDLERPYLAAEVATMDASIYHLDGPDALQHTESLCAIERLDMIQWMPGEGYYDDDWSALNAKIDGLGKGQIFQGYYNLTAADIARIWETYTSRKLFFHVTPAMLAELPWKA
ncbi:MAG: hypothetical protein RRC34_08495 [Lentisphaeria bacterium]|nr:hypothetical protein [Lentisphaeria bacterium]